MSNTWKKKALGFAVAATIVATPAVASAASTDNDVPARLRLACARVPNLIIRTDNLTTRLEADASTMGSLAWLQARIDDATAAGRTQLVEVLQNRLAVRTAKLELLHQRSIALAHISELCTEHGL